ncbi:MAG TPA: site-specific integrase [Phycisphaerales bacterium]|nr:site-specific integrase [Phycisphaerales bacterium]
MKTGRKKFGTTDTERSIIDTVRLASRKVRGGRVPTLRSIADKLNALGHVTKSGGQFRPQTIAAIQKRIADGEFRTCARRIRKTQLTSGDFRSQDQIESDLFDLCYADCKRPQKKSDLYFLYCILLGTGLRASELCDLQWRDVDVDKRMVNVRRGKGSKQRSIIISRVTAGLFVSRGINSKAARDPVFTNSAGGKLSYDALHDRGKKIAAIIGDPRWHLHCMRHTFATRLYNYKKDINFVADQLGHSSIETTRIYAKTLNSEKLEQMDAMDSLGKSPTESSASPDSTSKPEKNP